MGEEKKPDEQKKPATDTKDEQKNSAPEEKPKPDDKKPENPENQTTKEINNNNSNKDNNDSQPEAPPPAAEIVLRVYMHCEGCARKVHRCLKGFEGIEDVITDCKSHKVVVKGEKADPLKVVERVQKKTHRQVELLSPVPKPEEENKVVKKEEPKTEKIKTEPKVITVVLKVHMHCEACSIEIKKRIERMKEVEEAIPDLKSSQVSVKGTFDPPKLVDYVYKRTGKHAIIVKQDPPQETKEDDRGKDGKDEKKGEEEGKKTEEKGEEGKGEKKEEGDGVGGATGDGGATVEGEEEMKMELRRNEYNYNYYAPGYAMEMNTYPPQMFSDENPNACSIM